MPLAASYVPIRRISLSRLNVHAPILGPEALASGALASPAIPDGPAVQHRQILRHFPIGKVPARLLGSAAGVRESACQLLGPTKSASFLQAAAHVLEDPGTALAGRFPVLGHVHFLSPHVGLVDSLGRDVYAERTLALKAPPLGALGTRALGSQRIRRSPPIPPLLCHSPCPAYLASRPARARRLL
ncbi:hypothetical protein K488DRAFT_67787 [Vararia minispora EC-137]|uniref:Uncharacterized protein n=1 Tax=Vararia minispora EC-137 TaxID=1314806 RepID=A0ACB8QWV9_9AGAM|nr:hypothetical protein K488DRAFT_67787 [Vararia minispora EC-137]